MVVAPSKCTVLIQNVLLVDWRGVTVTTVFAAVVVALLLALYANTLWDVWICIPRIIAADTITTATVAVAIMIKGLVLSCIALSIPSPIITYPITITVKSVATVLSITTTPNAVIPISAPPTIRRVVVNFDLFFPRI
jgi:hypothetical protein